MKTMYTTVIIIGQVGTLIGTNREGKLASLAAFNYYDWSKVGKD